MPEIPPETLDLQTLGRSWLQTKKVLDLTAKREQLFNKELKQRIQGSEELRDPNDGHFYLDVMTPNGTVQVQMQVRQSVLFDVDVASQILSDQWFERSLNIVNQDALLAAFDNDEDRLARAGVEVVREPTQDSAREAFYHKAISEEELESCFVTKTTYALLPKLPKGMSL